MEEQEMYDVDYNQIWTLSQGITSQKNPNTNLFGIHGSVYDNKWNPLKWGYCKIVTPLNTNSNQRLSQLV